MKIYASIGQNFERIANLRYAVTYRPGANAVDRACAREIAGNIAREWADAMDSVKQGAIKDFVAVGDVDIKVIGADNQMIGTEVPVRQMLEQIVAKLGVPPFLLGLNWSTTERMSAQQADILTSELESYLPSAHPRAHPHLHGLSGACGATPAAWTSHGTTSTSRTSWSLPTHACRICRPTSSRGNWSGRRRTDETGSHPKGGGYPRDGGTAR